MNGGTANYFSPRGRAFSLYLVILMFSGWWLVVPKNVKSVYTCEDGSFGYTVNSKDLSHTKFIIHEASIEQIHTVCFIGTHGSQMPLVWV